MAKKSDPHEETSFSPHPTSKSIFSHFLPKLLFLLFLLFLPFSPSRAPEFINETVFAQFWEFLHIIFFGIAVSYGLLSRKNQNAGGPQSQSLIVRSQNYFSGILRFPSVSEENNTTATIIRLDEKARIETWNSRYLPPRSMNMSIRDEGIKLRSAMEYRPLGLPIRSLRRSSKVDHTDIQQESSDQRSWSSSDSMSSVEMEREKIRGLVPMNLEKRFNETSAIPWKRSSRSSSGRRKKKIDESESFWASVLSENSPLPYSPKNNNIGEDGNLDGRRAILRGKSVRTIRTENMYKKRSNNVYQESPTQNQPEEEKEEETERSRSRSRSSSSIDSSAIDEVEEESVERRGDGEEKEVDHDHGHDDDDEEDGKEVDRKADEFIAKFREQIRLQKVNSARGFKNW